MSTDAFENEIGLYRITYTIMDEKGQQSRTSINFPRQTWFPMMTPSVPLEPAKDPEWFALKMGELIDKVITGQIVNISVTYNVTRASFIQANDTRKTAPDMYSDVEHGGIIEFDVKDAPNNFKLWLPTIRDDLIIPGTDKLFLSHPDGHLANVEFMMTNAVDAEIGADWGFSPVDHRGNTLRFVVDAYQAFRPRGRR